MKYIITESQLRLIKEDYRIGLKRRFNYESMEKHIHDAELDYPMFCDDFDDEFEYADAIINDACDTFLTEDENFLDLLVNDYDEAYDYIRELTKDWFGDYLIETYQSTCEDYD